MDRSYCCFCHAARAFPVNCLQLLFVLFLRKNHLITFPLSFLLPLQLPFLTCFYLIIQTILLRNQFVWPVQYRAIKTKRAHGNFKIKTNGDITAIDRRYQLFCLSVNKYFLSKIKTISTTWMVTALMKRNTLEQTLFWEHFFL